MKLRIITHHSVHNHGALLQLYALRKVLSKYDSSVCALDYRKNMDFLPKYATEKYNISLRSVPFYLGFMMKKGVRRTLFNIKKRRTLNIFKKKNALVGEYYTRVSDVDAVFIGSDEVFSIESGLNTFFWGIGVPAKFSFAYAGCFGPTTIDFIQEKNAIEYIEAGIKHFNEISVRDMNSRNIICELSNKTPELVCDPVILYGFQRERKSFKRPYKEKYLLVYSYDENMNDEFEYKYICQYAKENKMKVITAGFYHKWCDKCINVCPIELLNWITFADCVVTDTFHGTVMSLIMNVPFAVKIRSNRNKLGFLLEEYEVLDREIHSFSEIPIILSKEMSFENINRIIFSKQELGKAYIDRCIKKIK